MARHGTSSHCAAFASWSVHHPWQLLVAVCPCLSRSMPWGCFGSPRLLLATLGRGVNRQLFNAACLCKKKSTPWGCFVSSPRLLFATRRRYTPRQLFVAACLCLITSMPWGCFSSPPLLHATPGPRRTRQLFPAGCPCSSKSAAILLLPLAVSICQLKSSS